MAALQGANIVGADSRCASNGTSSLFAFIKVAQPDDSFGNPSFVQSVRTRDGDGIEPIDSLQVLFDNVYNCVVLGVDQEEHFDNHFKVYPSPFKDRISIQNLSEDEYELEVIDATGNIILKTTIEERLDIDGSSYPSGLYFIKMSRERKVFLKKVIKY
jgi:hypothetical protein